MFFLQQAELADSYKEQYSVEKERNMDLEKEIKMCKVILHCNMQSLSHSSVFIAISILVSDEYGGA